MLPEVWSGVAGGLNRWAITSQCYSPGRGFEFGREDKQADKMSVFPGRQAGQGRCRVVRGVKKGASGDEMPRTRGRGGWLEEKQTTERM